MNQRELRYFLEVARTKNFSKAASNLFVTQPTISNQIKRLEDELGVQLFTRSYHNVSLTAYGKILISSAEKILSTYSALLQQFDQMQRVTAKALTKQELKIGLYINDEKNNILDKIELFKREFPNINIIVDNTLGDDLVSQLVNHQFDIVIGAIVPHSKIEWHFLFNDRFVVYISDRFVAKNQKAISKSELVGKALVEPPYRGLSFYKKRRDKLLKWPKTISVNSVDAGLSNLKLSDSFMFLPADGVQLTDPHIVKLPLKDIEEEKNRFPVGMAFLKEASKPAISDFIAFQSILSAN